MPRKTRKTGFDHYVERELKSPSFRRVYAEARAEIDSTDGIIRKLIHALDAARDAQHLSKAELARNIATPPEVLRRLFTTTAANPTLSTVVKLASALGYRLELVSSAQAKTKKSATPRSADSASGIRRQVALRDRSPTSSRRSRSPDRAP